MADDITEDLRYCANIHAGRIRHECIGQAADLLTAQAAEIERLRAAGDAMAAELLSTSEYAAWDAETIPAWEEARRG